MRLFKGKPKTTTTKQQRGRKRKNRKKKAEKRRNFLQHSKGDTGEEEGGWGFGCGEEDFLYGGWWGWL